MAQLKQADTCCEHDAEQEGVVATSRGKEQDFIWGLHVSTGRNDGHCCSKVSVGG